MVSAIDLSDIDTFEYKEGEYAMEGRNTGLRFAMGDKVKVRVAAANLVKRQIDYVLAEVPEIPVNKKKSVPAGRTKASSAAKGGKINTKKRK